MEPDWAEFAEKLRRERRDKARHPARGDDAIAILGRAITENASGQSRMNRLMVQQIGGVLDRLGAIYRDLDDRFLGQDERIANLERVVGERIGEPVAAAADRSYAADPDFEGYPVGDPDTSPRWKIERGEKPGELDQYQVGTANGGAALFAYRAVDGAWQPQVSAELANEYEIQAESVTELTARLRHLAQSAMQAVAVLKSPDWPQPGMGA